MNDGSIWDIFLILAAMYGIVMGAGFIFISIIILFLQIYHLQQKITYKIRNRGKKRLTQSE